METNCIEYLKYSVGGLLYAPAMNRKVPKKIKNKVFPCLTSLAFCLEDTIKDDCLEAAERSLYDNLEEISKMGGDLPLIFIRIRTPQHMRHVMELYKEFESVISGYILPKYDLSNMEEYIKLTAEVNRDRKEKPVYIMPILESRMVADIGTRVGTLIKIKEGLDTVRDYVLNVRVGGNDFCNLYGVRRAVTQTIYDVGVIRDIFVDIINIFGSDYVLSGPVWEYFGDEKDGKWDAGLMKELELDRLNGFIGKTAIHPLQLPIIFESLKVKRSDYDDAAAILNWDRDSLGVSKSENGSRMNEVKVHGRWAAKILTLGKIYGIKEE